LLIAGLILGKQQTSDFFGVMAQAAKDFLQTKLGKKFVPVLRWADRMTKDSVNSPINPPGRRVIAYANVFAYAYAYAYANANAIPFDYAFTKAIAFKYANAIAIAINYDYAIAIPFNYAKAIDYAKAIKSLITLAELFQQDKIFSTVNYQPLSTKLREEQDFLNTKPQLTEKEFEERIQAIVQVWHQTFSLTPVLLNFKYWEVYGEIKGIDDQYFYIYRLMLDCQKIAPNLAPGVWAKIENGMLLP
jgi:hypothetical protein